MTTQVTSTSSKIPWRLLGVWTLLLPGVIALQPAFGGLFGFVPGLVGVTAGAVVAYLGWRLSWRLHWWALALIGVYLLLGGPLVLPRTTILGLLPSLETIQRLTLLTFQSWRDLLTVATPVGDLSGPAAAPFLAGLLLSAALGAIVLNTRAVLWPLLLPVLWLAANIAFGTRTAPTAGWLGGALGILLLGWITAHRLARQQRESAQVLLVMRSAKQRLLGEALIAAIVVSVTAGLGIAGAIPGADHVNRQVLRDNIAPPLNLADYPSPLTRFRLYEIDLKDETLFTVRGVPAKTRLRLATMDVYDGNVFNVSQQSSQYLRSGRQLPPTVSGTETALEVEVAAYSDVWVPGIGAPTVLNFTGEAGAREADGLYYNKNSRLALTTARLGDGSRVEITSVPARQLTKAEREELTKKGAGSAPLVANKKVPDVLLKNATDWTADATSAFEQLEALESRLREEGFYSDGADGKSRSGHTSERLATMFTAPQLIGDDEQYATAMALMASQLGIPVRVVLGFYPAEGKDAPEEWAVTGTQAHVWVEANLDGAGWVSFDPTPDRDKLPKTDAPQPKPKPKPQVDPPPTPPERVPDEPVVADEEAARRNQGDSQINWGALLAALGIIVGVGAITAGPFLAILFAKRIRTKRRRTRGQPHDQLAGAWADIVDRARDLGHVAVGSQTRQESAHTLSKEFADESIAAFAGGVDAGIFGARQLRPEDSKAAWEHAEGLKHKLLNDRPWYRRPLAVFSLRSLRKPRIAPKTPKNKPKMETP